MMLVSLFGLLLLAFAIPSFSVPTPRSSMTGFDLTRNDNIAVYWGQDGSGNQQELSAYCNDSSVDVIVIAFLYDFSGIGGMPEINLANICSPSGTNVFNGTNLADCSFLAPQIKACQNNGKIVTLSLGGATSTSGFASDSDAEAFADTIWKTFLGGSGPMRPFGSAVLDGVDLDIESGSPGGYAAFVKQIRANAKGGNKRYYVSAAPQCPFPDVYIGDALNSAPFDFIFVQFYNNYCELSKSQKYNFAMWDHWAKTQSPNPDVKVFIGAPSSSKAAGSGYVDVSHLGYFANQAQQTYSSFGGVMLWDISMAVDNENYHQGTKSYLVSGAKNKTRRSTRHHKPTAPSAF